MRRITKIEIENCRAYFGAYKIDLTEGENLLIYGENGAGKSSFFKSFNDFFKNSTSTLPFSKNLYNQGQDGKLEITFSDFVDTGNVTNITPYKFANVGSNNSVSFIKDSSLINGFLDYTDLLKIYLKSEPNPNLFDLIIRNLLQDFIPVAIGASYKIGERYDFLIKNLITDARTRKSRCHKLGLGNLKEFDDGIRVVLDLLFKSVNHYLTKFFELEDLTIDYELKPIEFRYPENRKASWYLETDLRLKVLKNGTELGEHYKDFLNEARLSSVAICLYLSSLKLYPSEGINYKMIYLDDIFIGLDTSNRIPILHILDQDFKTYQIFISTYDKAFFEVCNQVLKNEKKGNWKAIELFVGEHSVENLKIDVPIVLSTKTDLDKARYHLYNNEYPDYPAAANYFRKYLEGKLKDVFPSEIFKDNNSEEIESYRLSKNYNSCMRFLENLAIEVMPLSEVSSYIYLLLHPLSHYNFSLNTYKRDLRKVDTLFIKLFEVADTFNFLKNIKFCASAQSVIRIEYFINQYNSVFYEFYLDEPLFFDKSQKGFSKGTVRCVKYYQTKNNKPSPETSLNPSTTNIVYDSIFDAHEVIGKKYIGSQYRFYKKHPIIFDVVKIYDGKVWRNFKWKEPLDAEKVEKIKMWKEKAATS